MSILLYTCGLLSASTPFAQLEPGMKADYTVSADFLIHSFVRSHVYSHEAIGNPVRKEKVLFHIPSVTETGIGS